MTSAASYGPTATQSAESTRKPTKSNDVACSGKDFGRVLESGPKFSLVEQSTPGTEPKYTDTPWTVPLIAAHNWLQHDISRVIRASGRRVG
jgi:hypothetical protein